MFLLDTDTLSLLFGGHERVTNRSRQASVNALVATTVVSRIEVLKGRFDFFLKAADESQLRRARDWLIQSETDLSRIHLVGLDDSAASEYERLRMIKPLKKIGRADLLIACITLACNATVVTRNVKDFKLVPGLKYENWAD